MSFATCCVRLELRSLPSAGVTRFPRYYSPPPQSARPVPHGRPVGPVIPDLTALWGFPCCARFPCVRAAASTPVQRLGVVFAHLTQPYQPSPKLQSGRPAHRPFRGLLGVHSRCGPHTRAVTKFVTAIRGLQTFRRLHACPSCFRLERLAGRGFHPLESAAFSRRTSRAAIRSSRLNVAIL